MSIKFVNLGSHNSKSLNDCADKGLPASEKENSGKGYCGDEKGFDGWLDEVTKKKGLGEPVLCDPMQTGQIVNDVRNPGDRSTVYRYSNALRSNDEAMVEMFKNVIVLDEDGKAHPVPIIWATQEKAVAAIVQDNVRKDDSLVVDRIRLPMMAIYSNSHNFNQSRYVYHKAVDYMRDMRPDHKPGFTQQERQPRDTIFGVARGLPMDIGYTLTVWTMYVEDMNQIIEQIYTKFSPIAYIRVRGVPWETIVKLDSIANNIDTEPGDMAIRIVKFEFNFTVETFIPQPLVRRKAVLKAKLNVVDNPEIELTTDILDRIEEAVGEINDSNN